MDENDREHSDELANDPGDDAAVESVTAQTVRVRRSPRYFRFMIVGVVVCVIVAFILTYSFPQGAGYDRNSVFGYLVLVAIALGVALGSLVAIVADRLSARTARTVTANRIVIDEVPFDADELDREPGTSSDEAPAAEDNPSPTPPRE